MPDYPFTWPAELGEPDVILSPPVQSIPANGVVDYRYYFIRPPFPSNVWLRALYALWSGRDLPRVGFWLHTNNHPRSLRIGAPRDSDPPISISPYQQDYSIQRDGVFERDVLVYGMNPHMHLRGARMMVDALYPDGTHEILINVPHYDFHWQTLYCLKEPKHLPAGTRLFTYGTFDNSPQNPHNPDPSVAVLFGEQTTDEMFADFVRYAETLTLRSQPRSINVARGGRASFSVTADSPSSTPAYQWRFNGADIPGATNSTLTVTNVQTPHKGLYTAVMTDLHDSIATMPATLRVGDPPVITVQPLPVTVPIGGDAAFSVTVSGMPPFGYQWRKVSNTLTTIVTSATSSTVTLFHVRTNDAGSYRVVVTNAFNMVPGVGSPLVPLTVTTP